MIATDELYMRQALALAEKGVYTTTPNPSVGCVLVNDYGMVVGEGYHQQAGGPHAEVHALQQAGERAHGGTAYVTLEPCSHWGRTPPCCEALVAAGVATVVYAMTDPNPEVSGRGIEYLRAAGITVRGPVMAREALAINRGFVNRMTRGVPRILCKMAMSLDGRTAMASGQSQWITGSAARAQVQQLRARSCAIVTGVGTVIHDDPSLNVRDPVWGDNPRQPVRVVVDSRRRSPKQAKVFVTPGKTVVASAEPGKESDSEVWHLPSALGEVDLHQLVAELGRQQFNEVMLEAGPTLAGSFLRQNLIDELVLFVAPKLLGSSARPLFDFPLERLEQALNLEIGEAVAVGEDLRINARRRED